jgi:hypothetical protein
MFSKRILIAIIVVLGLGAALLAAPEKYRWLVLNQSRAEALAAELLSGRIQPVPEWAWDLVVVREDGVVIYAPHDPAWLVAFSPGGRPSFNRLKWVHVWGKWYVADIGT